MNHSIIYLKNTLERKFHNMKKILTICIDGDDLLVQGVNNQEFDHKDLKPIALAILEMYNNIEELEKNETR